MTSTRNRALALAIAPLLLALPAFAEGDAAAGEGDYKKCKACHMIVADDGTEIQKGGKTGPNLYGIVGRAVASADFKYGDSIKAVGESGVVWDEAELVAYMSDPKAWLAEKTGDAGAKSKMTFKLTKGQEDMAAYLASVSPEADSAGEAATN
ncbi:Cytochrome c-551 [Defluviimonas aquaemixtae]|uniref:Cytochrome c-551 n=1 Tax=Albidovulum aquaemixtae TaxID=1542388 RepID=A0A2R8B785_9RHOB|nr:c-type cytochrome [Defluviimonas aquaemixtae]SPH18488.1 Cytochrome c-551 [Defluviimonas aquaemixtae]